MINNACYFAQLLFANLQIISMASIKKISIRYFVRIS